MFPIGESCHTLIDERLKAFQEEGYGQLFLLFTHKIDRNV